MDSLDRIQTNFYFILVPFNHFLSSNVKSFESFTGDHVFNQSLSFFGASGIKISVTGNIKMCLIVWTKTPEENTNRLEFWVTVVWAFSLVTC